MSQYNLSFLDPLLQDPYIPQQTTLTSTLEVLIQHHNGLYTAHQASQHNSRARALNACLLTPNDTLVPLHNITTNEDIPDFPMTSRQIQEMDLIVLDPVLGELGYSLEDLNKTTCTRRLLRAVIGLPADFPVVAA